MSVAKCLSCSRNADCILSCSEMANCDATSIQVLDLSTLTENVAGADAEGVVSKETVVLRRWGSSIQKFGFINGVDNVNWPPYRDSKS